MAGVWPGVLGGESKSGVELELPGQGFYSRARGLSACFDEPTNPPFWVPSFHSRRNCIRCMVLGVQPVQWVWCVYHPSPNHDRRPGQKAPVTPHVCLFPHYMSQIINDMAYGVLVGQPLSGLAPESRPEAERTRDPPGSHAASGSFPISPAASLASVPICRRWLIRQGVDTNVCQGPGMASIEDTLAQSHPAITIRVICIMHGTRCSGGLATTSSGLGSDSIMHDALFFHTGRWSKPRHVAREWFTVADMVRKHAQ